MRILAFSLVDNYTLYVKIMSISKGTFMDSDSSIKQITLNTALFLFEDLLIERFNNE
jgi:hypothetical protein